MSNRRFTFSITTAALTACVAIGGPVAGASAANGVSVTTVFRTGDPVPGLPGFEFFGFGGEAVIGENGDVLAVGLIVGPDVNFNNNNVLVSRTAGGLSILARELDPVPTIPGFQYLASSINLAGFYELGITPGGLIQYRPDMRNTANGSFGLQGIFAGPPGAEAPFLYEQGPAPGYPGGTMLRADFGPVHRDAGAIAAFGRVTPDNITALFFGAPGAVTAVLQTGLQAPGLPIGVNIQSFNTDSLGMDLQNNVVFHATLPLGNGINQSNRVILYSGQPNNVGVLARTGEPAPGLAGATLTGIIGDSVRMSPGGGICYQAFVSGGGTDEVIITGGSGTFGVLARDGQPLPGDPSVALDRVARGKIDMNPSARVAFDCSLSGAPFSRDTAILIGDPNSLETVLREGDPLPGGGLAPNLSGALWTFNDRGQFAFLLPVGDETVLYATRPNGELVRLASTGEALSFEDGPPGLVAAISFDFAPRADLGKSAIFNSDGQLVLPIRLVGAGGTGVFVFEIDDPCPADLVPPSGLLDLNDINAFVNAFVSGDPQADLDGSGLIDLTDVNIFVGSFTAGCPD
jgi:hypothetical protein